MSMAFESSLMSSYAECCDTAQRLYRPLPDGSREYLTADELSDARNTADQAISTWCD